MVGASPITSPNTSTSVPTEIVPVILSLPDGRSLDPTSQPTPCAPPAFANTPEITLFQQSPLFQNHDYVFNDVDVGSTQFADAFQRANFWSLVGGQNYHVLLNPVTTLAAVTVNVPASAVLSPLNLGCGNGVQLDITWVQTYVQNTLIPQLAGQGVGPATFPIVLLSGLVYSSAFHAAFGNPSQTYVVGAAGPMAHEIAEWMDNPLTRNTAPQWGYVGQDSSRCDPSFEVADAVGKYDLSATMPNGYTYGLAGLAYYSWFMGSPSLAAGGGFSNDGTFTGQATLCPPGGSNPPPPVITTQPLSQSIGDGMTATMSVAATGTDGPLQYQWYVGASGMTGNPIAGATSASYTTPTLTATTAYWVRVQDANGTAFSSAATMTLPLPPPAPSPPTNLIIRQ